MDVASSAISAEKNSVGPGVVGIARKLDGCDVKHEIVALILTCYTELGDEKTQARMAKRQWAGGTPTILYESQMKGVTEFAFRKLLILKGAISAVWS